MLTFRTESAEYDVVGVDQKSVKILNLAAKIRLIRHINIKDTPASAALHVIVRRVVEVKAIRTIGNRDVLNLSLFRQNLEITVDRRFAD